MNILYIHTHDTGRFIEPYGYKIDTPNLKKLASRGTIFGNCFCAGPTCSPSRAALLTGMYPHMAGMTGLAHRGFSLNDYDKHLVNFLNRNNYNTILCGIQHEASSAEKIGYKTILNNEKEDEMSERAESDIKNAERTAKLITSYNSDKPFFISAGFFSTHRAFPKTNINPDNCLPPPNLPNNQKTREDMAGYMTSAKIADDCVGIVLDSLNNSSFCDNTMVIFTTDHGIAFPYMKCTLYDGGTGVSLIVDYPDNPSRKKRIDSLISHVDIFPTICDICNLKKPDWLVGKSFLPVLEGKKKEINESVYSEINYHSSYEPMRSIRTERYKYIKYFGDRKKLIPNHIDKGLSKDFVTYAGYEQVKKQAEELYDLHIDPNEKMNLANLPDYIHIKMELSKKLLNNMKKYKDPVLNGVIACPDKSKII